MRATAIKAATGYSIHEPHGTTRVRLTIYEHVILESAAIRRDDEPIAELLRIAARHVPPQPSVARCTQLKRYVAERLGVQRRFGYDA